MVSGGSDKILKRWDLPLHNLKTNKLTKLTPSHSVRAHEKDVNAVAISPNDSIVASGSQDKSIRLWRSTDLTAIASLKGHKRGIWRLVFSPIDKTLASSSGDRTVRLWSMVDHSCLRTFEGHTASVLCIRFINKGTQLLSGSADGLIRLWTIRTGECENTFDEHQDKVWTICCNLNDDSKFFSGGSDSRFIVWKDFTEETENDRLKVEEETLLLEQQMHNDIRNKRYGEVKLYNKITGIILYESIITLLILLIVSMKILLYAIKIDSILLPIWFFCIKYNFTMDASKIINIKHINKYSNSNSIIGNKSCLVVRPFISFAYSINSYFRR